MREMQNDLVSPAIRWLKLTEHGLLDCSLDPVVHTPVTLSTFDSARIESRSRVCPGNPIDSYDSTLSLAEIVSTHQFCDVYYHWVFDIIPRVVFVMNVLGESCKISLPKPRFHFQTEWLAIAAPKATLSFFDGIAEVYRGPVAIPSTSTTGTVASPRTINLIQRLAREIRPAKKIPKLYIRRQGNVSRKIVNENDLERILQTKGFIAVDSASISVGEQIALFKGAEIIVSAHGSALTNLVFCQPQTAVIEIFGPLCGETVYPRIAKQSQLQHIGVQASELAYFDHRDRVRHALGSPDAPFHFKVDPALIIKALATLGH